MRGLNDGAPVRVGVVGCGYWGSKHVRVLHSLPGVNQVVAIDRDQEILDALHGAYPGIKTARSFDDSIEDLDAVVIATPPRTHAPLARAALLAGCHVMVEKPLATSVTEAEELVDLSSELNRTLMCGHTFEYNPAVWKLREIVQRGDLGEVYHIDTARLNLGLYQGDVNVIWDLAPHDISILNYLLGTQPTSVKAWARPHAHRFLEDVAYLQLDYGDKGVTAQIHVSWLDPCKIRRVTVVGSEKMAVYDDMVVDERVRVFDKGVAFGPNTESPCLPVSYRHGGIESPWIDFQEPLMIEDRQFIHSVRTGERPPSDGESGLAVVRVLEAAERSVRDGVAVAIDSARRAGVAA